MEPNPNPILAGYALVLLVGLPVLAALDARRGIELEHAVRFRRAIYGSIALSLLVVTAITLGVASWQRVRPASLGWQITDATEGFVWGVAVAAAGLILAWLVSASARALNLSEGRIAQLLMPRDAREKRAFLMLSGIAAVCEEYVFRGFLLWTLTAWTSSPWFAAAIVSASFGLAHGYQRLAGIARASSLGFLLCVPVIVTGSLFPAIVAHFWINAAVGLGGWRYLIPDEPDLETAAETSATPGGAVAEDDGSLDSGAPGASEANDREEKRMDREVDG